MGVVAGVVEPLQGDPGGSLGQLAEAEESGVALAAGVAPPPPEAQQSVDGPALVLHGVEQGEGAGGVPQRPPLSRVVVQGDHQPVVLV